MWGKTANVIVQTEHVTKKELEVLIREAWEFNLPLPKKPARRPAKPNPRRK